MARLDVLVTAASRRVGLVRALQRALRRPGIRGEVIACDVNPASPAVHVADRAYQVPYSDDPGYFDAVLAICERHRVGLIVPTIDDEIPHFARVQRRFAAAGIRVAASAFDTAVACTDKYETCRRLRAAGVAAAETWLPGALPPQVPLPAFVKPRTGRGSVQAFPARTAEELAFFLHYVSSPVVQEFLDGPEFTLDLFCDFAGRPLSVVPRERVVIRAGVIDRGRTVKDPALTALALACAEVFTFAGPVNIQCRIVDGRPRVFEINPRFSGGIPLTIAAGADFAAMLVDLALDRPVPPAIGEFQADLWMSSYESSLFLPADALVLERSVHEEVGQDTP